MTLKAGRVFPQRSRKADATDAFLSCIFQLIIQKNNCHRTQFQPKFRHCTLLLDNKTYL